MHISSSTTDNISADTCDNTLVSELLSYGKAYATAKKKTTAAQPFMAYYHGSDEIEMDFYGSLRGAKDSTNSLYIVAPDNPIQSFSLIARKVLPNTLKGMHKDALRKALGSLLDKA